MLIDANVFMGYFQTQIKKPHSLQGCPEKIFLAASASTPIYHDKNGIIEQEWRDLVDPDWFDAWLSYYLVNGSIQILEPVHYQPLEKSIQSLGFPKKGRDIVYVRTALSDSNLNGKCNFYTEDIDFYEPTAKKGNSKSRKKIILSSSGSICKELKKHHIVVQCVSP